MTAAVSVSCAALLAGCSTSCTAGYTYSDANQTITLAAEQPWVSQPGAFDSRVVDHCNQDSNGIAIGSCLYVIDDVSVGVNGSSVELDDGGPGNSVATGMLNSDGSVTLTFQTVGYNLDANYVPQERTVNFNYNSCA